MSNKTVAALILLAFMAPFLAVYFFAAATLQNVPQFAAACFNSDYFLPIVALYWLAMLVATALVIAVRCESAADAPNDGPYQIATIPKELAGNFDAWARPLRGEVFTTYQAAANRAAELRDEDEANVPTGHTLNHEYVIMNFDGSLC